jgi:hypothetical protein
MQVTPEHAKAVSERARMRMEEGFFLDGIALHSTDVSPRHVESSSLVIAHFTNTGLPFGNWAAMPAGKAAHPIAIKLFV